MVIDVETSCSRGGGTCRIGIVGSRDGCETFAWETLLEPCHELHAGDIRIHGLAAHHVVSQPR